VLDRYPIVERLISLGGRDWRILAVADQDRLLDTVKDDSELDRFPYGLMLWESAFALAEWLLQEVKLLRNLRVLELGAGSGLPGIVATRLGAKVVQTDYLPEALELAALNARANDVHGIDRHPLDWRSPVRMGDFDLIIASDVLYDRALHVPLMNTLWTNACPSSRILIADPVRPQGIDFVDALERRGWPLRLSSRMITWGRQDKEIALYDLRLPQA
jgi:predicted nicotinamide N-methyase